MSPAIVDLPNLFQVSMMSKPQPPKKTRDPLPAPTDSGVVKPHEIEALLGSLGDVTPESENPAPDPNLQTWFEGMIDYLPGQENTGDRGKSQSNPGNLQAKGPVESSSSRTPRPGRMESWEVGNSAKPSTTVRLGTAESGSSPGAGSVVTPEDLEQLLPATPASIPQRALKPLATPERSNREAPGKIDTAHLKPRASKKFDSVSSVTSAPPAKSSPAKSPPETSAIDSEERDAALREQILIELQRVPALANLPLHVSVENGSVTLVGDLAGDYEKQLVSHFARKVKGVTEVIDLTRVRTSASPAPATAPRPAPRKPASKPRSDGGSLSLTLRPTWVAGIAGLVVLAWAGLSFGKKDVDRIEVHPAQGRVTFGETIPEGALLTLHPVSPTVSIRPRATVRPDGTFQVTTYGTGDGAPEGDYRVTIVWHKLVEIDGEPTAGPNLLPSPYSQPATTELKLSVKPGTNDFPPLQIHP